MKKKLIITISVITSLVLAIIISLLLIGNKEETYTIIFNSDGGTKIENQIVQKGEKVNKPSDPQKEGYKFISWTYRDETYDFSKEVKSDMELKAKWYKIKEEVKEYTIKFNSDGGTTIENQIIEEGQKVIKPDDPTKEGYKFSGWYLNDEEFNFESQIDRDMELKAKWEKVKVPANNNNNTNNESNNNAVNNNNKEETIKVETPTLSNPNGYETGRAINAKLHIFFEGYYADNYTMNKLSGWELYEKVGSKYNLVDTKTKESIEITVDIGESKTYVARAYKLNKKNEKVYSAYSNELKIDNSKVETPTLSNPSGGIGVTTNFKLHIFIEGYYADNYTMNTLSGWELYEKVGSKYNLVDSKTKESIEITVDIGESKTYVARTYKLNKKNEKVYSAYSNELKIDNSKVEAPTLSSGHGSGGIEVYVGFTIALEGYYKEEWAANTISGWELYEKVGSKYNLVNGTQVSVDIGEVKTYVARAYALNKTGQKIYSDYSNEYKVDNSRPKTPTLTIGGGTESVALFTIGLEGYYKEEWTANTISGWELYEKVGDKYNKLDGTEVTVDIGEVKTYVARAYALNKAGQQIYSAYSNEITINNK